MFLAIVVIVLLCLWLTAAVVVVALCMAAAEGDRQLDGRVRRARRLARAARLGAARFAAQR